MDRTLTSEVINFVGSKVLLKGWLHKKRLLGGLNFITLRDRCGLIQVLVEDKAEVEKLRGLHIGTVLEITGEVIADQRAPQGAEIHNPKLNVLVPVVDESPIEIDKPLSHKSEHLDTLLDNRVVGLRNMQEQKIFKVRSTLNRYIREYLWENDFTEIQTPKLLAGATEGGSEVFKLDYFGKEATLAQSPQFYKQITSAVFERVFEIGPAYRAEPSATTRHVTEVTMLDLEFAFIENHDDVMSIVQDMTYLAITRTYEKHAADLKSLNAPELILKPNFPHYSMLEIHQMFEKATGKSYREQDDLSPEEERWICEYAKKNDGCEAVFATNLPKNKGKFYHQVHEDGKTVKSADLLFRGIEIATCPMRENRYEVLLAQMKEAGLDPTHPGFSYYLQAFKYGMPNQGGCGYGIDRLTQKVCGLASVKEAILFPRDLNRLTP